ncbi:MAG: amidohydrolase family protein [Acidimicrobiia bacterium]
MGDDAVRYPIADADNHLYETRDAFTRHLPPGYENLIRFVEIDGRQQLVIKDKLSFILPNPTLEKVAPPGKYESAETQENLPRVIVSPPEFFEPEPRLRWMRETGIDRAVLFPTLGLSVEGRLGDPVERTVMVKAFNRWLLDQWTFDYDGALFTAPLITLSRLDEAMAELDWAVEHDAKVIYIQPGFVVTDRGRTSMALPQFDPFWRKVEDYGVIVGMHSGDGGQTRYMNEWEGTPDQDLSYFGKRDPRSAAFRAFIGQYERLTQDLMGSLVCHGLLTRFPTLKILPAEQGTGWVRPTLRRFEELWATSRQLFEENPLEVMRRNVKIHLFRDPDPVGLVRLVGADAAVFGSDFPHPEGQANPLDFADKLAGLDDDEIRLVMGGNLDRMLGVEQPVA